MPFLVIANVPARRIAGACVAAFLLQLSAPLHSATSPIQLDVSPRTMLVNTPAVVTVRAIIADASAIPASVNLYRLDDSGRVLALLATLKDDGEGGDAFAGDSIFTAQIVVSEPTTARVSMQVTAALRGVLLRIKSDVATVFVQHPEAAQRSLEDVGHALSAGEMVVAATYFVPSSRTIELLDSLTATERTRLANALTKVHLASSEPDLRVFETTWTNEEGNEVPVELMLIPDEAGRWVISSW